MDRKSYHVLILEMNLLCDPIQSGLGRAVYCIGNWCLLLAADAPRRGADCDELGRPRRLGK